MKDIIIFGIGKIADVIQFYMREESGLPVKAFTVDHAYIKEPSFNGLPVDAFENIEEKYPPEKYSMFVAVGYHNLNEVRAAKIKEAEAKGYEIISYVHPQSSVPKDLVYGKNCFIMNNVCIHPRVKLGDDVFVWSGAMIGHHSTIGDHCWFTSAANISGNVTIGNNCFFAVNATVAHSVTIGNEAFIGANVLLTKNLEDGKVVIAESDKAIKLNSKQFLKFSNFSNL
ncbi:MAG: pglD [Flavipsychrobacter sp.]|jgi:sugar O-acyltransferase (sialic acid O-acetyltransferase NeuD family)|nr:pglD [Flavipsychrobacter sp.]